MSSHESLSLPHRLELPRSSLPDPGRLMGLLCSIILTLFGTVNRHGYQLTVSYTIAPQLIRHNLPGFCRTGSQQTLEKMPRCCPIASRLQVYIDHFAILIHSSPQAVLLAIDLHKHFVDLEGIAESLKFSPLSSGIDGSEPDTEPAP